MLNWLLMHLSKMVNKYLAISLLSIVLFACNDASEPQRSSSLSAVGVVAAEAQRAGDPEAGYRALLNEAYITCGIPYNAYQRMTEQVDKRLLLADRDPDNAQLPYMLTTHTSAQNVTLVVSNCLSCHAAFFDDKLIIGLGNEQADWSEDLALVAESVGAYIDNEADAAEWRRWADRMAAIAPYAQTDTVGVNPADNLTLALIAHHDPQTLAWSQQALLEPPPQKPLPVSVPPWWRMKKKNALFYSTEGRGDHARFMMTAALLCTDSVEEARAIDAYGPDIRAYLAALEPPRYPYAIDHDKAVQGGVVFEQYCSRCHGTYGTEWTYPNLVIALAEIGTDPLLAQRAVNESQRFIDWYNQSFFGELARAAPAPGYIAPPLDAVWATAPYLHNGSVPTIAALLASSTRPKYWQRAGDDYDQMALGWQFSALDKGKDDNNDWAINKMIYDTSLPGYSNQGHLFGDVLSESQRTAVLEYLKTL